MCPQLTRLNTSIFGIKEKNIKSFFYHFNKPKSKQLGKPVISLHYDKACHFVSNLECAVPTKGRIRKTQPVFVITGKANEITIVDEIAFIK